MPHWRWCNYSFSITMWSEKSSPPVHPAANDSSGCEFSLAISHTPVCVCVCVCVGGGGGGHSATPSPHAMPSKIPFAVAARTLLGP
jgi:hypothetical protein